MTCQSRARLLAIVPFTGNREAPRSDLLRSWRIRRLLCLGRHLAPAQFWAGLPVRLFNVILSRTPERVFGIHIVLDIFVVVVFNQQL